MAITFNTSSGLFGRLGARFSEGVALLGFANTTIPTDWDNKPDLLAMMQTGLAGVQASCQAILIGQVNDDVALPNRSVADALLEVDRQLVSQAYYIDSTAVASGSVTADSGNTGNGQSIMSVVNVDGRTLANARAETITFECVDDGVTGNALAGEEKFLVTGEDAVPNLDPRWPKGSGIRFMAFSTSADIDGGIGPGRNILYNSDFELWAGGLPRYWTAAVGTAGVDFQQGSGGYRGSSSFEFIAGTAALTKITQQTASFTGTPVVLKPNTKYVLSVRAKTIGGAATGVLRFSIRDGSGSAIGTNDSGSAANLSQDVSLLSTSYALKQMFFHTGRLTTATTATVTVEATTAIASNNVQIDDLIICEPWQPHPGGPYMLILTGSTNWAQKDRIRQPITNDAAGDIARHLDRYFDMYGKGRVFITSGSTNVPDSLIA
jgi:hypothetical protein